MRIRKKTTGKSVKTSKSKAVPSAPITASEFKPDLVQGTPITEETKTAINKDLGMLAGRVREYLSSFIIIGYNLEELPIQVIYGKTQKDLDALNLALTRFIVHNTSRPDSQQPPSNPNEPHNEPH